MKKWILGCLTVFTVSVVVLGLVGTWIIHEAFGPIRRTVTIPLKGDQTLVCEETYNADLAAVFYDVDFVLQDKGRRPFHLGMASFSTPGWQKHIEPHWVGKWFLLVVRETDYSTLLMQNTITGKQSDTTFSALTLRYDSIWKKTTNEIPAWVYDGTSRLGWIRQNRFISTYHYRFGLNHSFRFFDQSIQYALDSVDGNVTTTKVFKAKQN